MGKNKHPDANLKKAQEKLPRIHLNIAIHKINDYAELAIIQKKVDAKMLRLNKVCTNFFELMSRWRCSKSGSKYEKQIERRMTNLVLNSVIKGEKSTENDKDFLLSVFKIGHDNIPVFLKETIKNVAGVALKIWSEKLIKELREMKETLE